MRATRRPAGSIETILDLADLLRYHGRTHGLCQGMMQDWPRLCDAPGLDGDEVLEYLDSLTSLLLEESPEVLSSPGEVLIDITRIGRKKAIARFARGDVRENWQPRDFETAKRSVLRDRLFELSLAFSRWLGDRVRWPAPRK